MAKKRKIVRNKHYCVNHHGKVARARCSVCGRWLCNECVNLKNGKFYCTDGCSGNFNNVGLVEEMPEENVFTSEASFKKQKIGYFEVAFLSIMTILTVVCLVSIIIMNNQMDLLKSEVSELRTLNLKYRNTLIERNRYIRKLKERYVLASADNRKPSVKNYPTEIRAYKYSSERLPLTFDNGLTSKKSIALTFDAGAHANCYRAILDTLASRDVKCTVFMTGKFVENNSYIVREIYSAGHVIGNHTFFHPHLTTWRINSKHITSEGINKKVIETELTKTNAIFKQVVGQDMFPIWRAPYGEKNSQIESWALSAGYIHIGWKQAKHWINNYDTNDWVPDANTPGFHTPKEVYEKFDRLSDQKPYGMNGAIILMHLGSVRKSSDLQVYEYLGRIIDMLRAKGYVFLTIPRMLKESGINISKIDKRL